MKKSKSSDNNKAEELINQLFCVSTNTYIEVSYLFKSSRFELEEELKKRQINIKVNVWLKLVDKIYTKNKYKNEIW